MGLKLVALNVDNYFFDLALHPKDEYGDYDFETPQALDLEHPLVELEWAWRHLGFEPTGAPTVDLFLARALPRWRERWGAP